MKLSHSAIDLYKKCGKAYKLRYKDKLTSKTKSSALFFGSALDEAFNYLLTHKDDIDVAEKTKEQFEIQWATQKNSVYEMIELKLSNEIVYYNSDFEIAIS